MSLVNIISAVGNNSSVYPLIVRDCGIEVPTKIAMTYNQNLKDSKQMANNALRERLIDEYGTSIVWLGGIPLMNAVADWGIKKLGYDPKVNVSLLKENGKQGLKYNIEKFKNLAPDEVKSNFSFQVEEITRFVPGDLTQEIFDQVFGEGNVKTEEEFRAKVKEVIANQFVADSDYKFLIDARKMLTEKVGKLEFPDALLKRIMRLNNPDKEESFVEDNYDKSIEELTWHLIKEQLVKANDIKVEQEDITNMAKEATRAQFAQYGMMSVPEEILENYSKEMLKKKESIEGLVNRVVESKLATALKSQVELEHKNVSAEEFNKMFA